MQLNIADFVKNDEGGALAEYGILAAALAIPMLAALGALGVITGSTLQTTGTGLSQLGIKP